MGRVLIPGGSPEKVVVLLLSQSGGLSPLSRCAWADAVSARIVAVQSSKRVMVLVAAKVFPNDGRSRIACHLA